MILLANENTGIFPSYFLNLNTIKKNELSQKSSYLDNRPTFLNRVHFLKARIDMYLRILSFFSSS